MIDVMIITFNEALNLPHCLAALQGWTGRVFVIDSGSTDQTGEIAESYGATFIHHDWPGYAQQKNWGLTNLPFESDWILIVDADEVITGDLRDRLIEIAKRPINDVRENGFFVNRLTYFVGKPIRHCGYYPNWNMRFFKRGKGFYEDRAVHEHIIIDNPVGYIKQLMLHDDRRGLEHYMAKHNRYSTLEARTIFMEMIGANEGRPKPKLSGSSRRRRWLKRYITPHVPMPGIWRFLYMYVFRLGILDGRIGFSFCAFISVYDHLVGIKLKELRRLAKTKDVEEIIASLPASALAVTEGKEGTEFEATAPPPIKPPAEGEPDHPVQLSPEASPWTFKEKLGRALWMLVGRPVFRISFHNWYRFRARLLRLFGARIGRGVAIRPSVKIEVPWMINIDDDATIGDHAILYSLGPITIGKRSIVSQYAHLCAGTHDYSDHTFKLIRSPVTIGDDAWIGADAFIGPGVKVGSLTVVGARSSAYKDLPDGQVCIGNPAKPLKERVLR
ncbi:MAG: WcaF family extracellular polysaccharide biosynthesis acetyltransferase [Phycisphaerales bacterium]|nr:WcaF family extracellular polysaccharide biosynthesis acetyltransferase [Phycisphaerales bacterium]